MKEVLIGAILGDAHLEPHGAGVRLTVRHAERFKPYIEWKRNELLELRPSPLGWQANLDKRSGENSPYCYFSTGTHPYLAALRKWFYEDKKKVVPINIGSLLTSPLSLAVWTYGN